MNSSSLTSVLQSDSTEMNSGPATGVQAIAKAAAAIIPHIPAEDDTARQNRAAGPPGGGSAAAQADTTARAIPAANQIIIGGRVALNQGSGRG